MGKLIFAVIVAFPSAGEPLPAKFHFPPVEPDKTLTVKHEGTPAERPERWKAKMVIDGTRTDGLWPEHPPTVYKLSKRAYFLDDHYSGAGDFVWDATEKKLTPIGQCYLYPVPGAGTMVIRRIWTDKPTVELLDFPEESGKPRVLWRGTEPSVSPLGVWDGAVVFVLGGKRLLVLEPGWPAKEITIDTGKFGWQANGDSIRLGKALLLGDFPPFGKMQGEYTVAVAVINLKTGAIKPIGRAPGGWSVTNVPHPVVGVWWMTQKDAEKLPKGDKLGAKFFNEGAYVIEETDEIVK